MMRFLRHSHFWLFPSAQENDIADLLSIDPERSGIVYLVRSKEGVDLSERVSIRDELNAK